MALLWLLWCFCCYIAGVATVLGLLWWLFLEQKEHKESDKFQEQITLTKATLPESLTLHTACDGDAGSTSNSPFKLETCIALNYLMQFFFQEKRYDSTLIKWMSNMISIEIGELLRHRALSKIVRNMQVKDLSLGSNFPVIESITPKKVIVNPDTNLLDLIELCMDVNYTGGFHLAIDATTKFSKTAMLSVKILKLSGKGRLQFSRVPFTHWSFSFYEEPYSEFEVESSVLGRHIPRFKTIIVNQLKSLLRRRHTLPYYKLRSKPLAPPGPIAAAGMTAAGRVVTVSRHSQVLQEDGCAVPPGRLRLTVVCCSRLQRDLLCGSLYCTVLLSDCPAVCCWEDPTSDSNESPDQWIILDLHAKKGSGITAGVLLKTAPDNTQVVESVSPHSAAGIAGVKAADVVLSVNGVKVTSAQQAAKLLTFTPIKAASLRGPSRGGAANAVRGKSLSTNDLQRGLTEASSTSAGGGGGSIIKIRVKRRISAKKMMDSGSGASSATRNEVSETVTAASNNKPSSRIFECELSSDSSLDADQKKQRSQSETRHDNTRQNRAAVNGSSGVDASTGGNNQGSSSQPGTPVKPPHNSMSDHNLPHTTSSQSLMSECTTSLAVDSSTASSTRLAKHASTPSLPSAVKAAAAPPNPSRSTSLSAGSNGRRDRNKVVNQRGGGGANSNCTSAEVSLNMQSTAAVDPAIDPTFPEDESTFEWRLSEEDKFITVSVWSEGRDSMLMSGVDGADTPDGAAPQDSAGKNKPGNVSANTNNKNKMKRGDSSGGNDSKRNSTLLTSLESTWRMTGCPPDTLVGHVTLPLVTIVPESSLNTRGHVVKVLPLYPPDPACPQADVYKLNGHKGFEPSLCYGDVTLSLIYKASELSFSMKRQSGGVSDEDSNSDGLSEEETDGVTTTATDSHDGVGLRKHDFRRTHFTSATLCDFCKKKIWLKDAYQCNTCAITCHKKCVTRCSKETVCSSLKEDSTDALPDREVVLSEDTGSTSAVPPEIVMTSPGGDEEAKRSDRSCTPPPTPQTHRRTLSSLLASMKSSSSSTSSAGSIKRTGSASNLSTAAEQEDYAKRMIEQSSVTHALTRATLSSFSGAMKRTGSANNISSSTFNDEKKTEKTPTKASKKTAELISSFGRSGLVTRVDDKNISHAADSLQSSNMTIMQSSRTLSPSQFFRSSKRSTSSGRCSSETSCKRRFDASSFLRRTPSADRSSSSSTRPHSSPSRSAMSSSSLLKTELHNHLRSEKSKSLPPSPQHSPPNSRKNSGSGLLLNPFCEFIDDSEDNLQHTIRLLTSCQLQDESLLTLARQSAPALLAHVPPLERKPRIAQVLNRVQGMVDVESDVRNELARAEREACQTNDAAARHTVAEKISLCDSRTQALALLSMYLFTALHLCQDQIEEQKEAKVSSEASEEQTMEKDDFFSEEKFF